MFSDKTPARLGEERGMQRTQCKEFERWDEGVRHDHNRKDYALQLNGSFRYNFRGVCHLYHHETEQEAEDAEVQLKQEKEDIQARKNTQAGENT